MFEFFLTLLFNSNSIYLRTFNKTALLEETTKMFSFQAAYSALKRYHFGISKTDRYLNQVY
jgi:hypothetical protein